MDRYCCPDHPDQVPHDDNPRSDANRPRPARGPIRVTCPVDQKVYTLPQCIREKTAD